MDVSSINGTELPLKPPVSAGHQSCSALNTDSSMFTPDDSTSVIAETSLDTKTKTLNVILANCNAVLVSQGEQIQPLEVEADSTVQPFSKPVVSEEESQQKSSNSSVEILLDVEPSLPIIRKQGVLNGPQCEEILKNLELLQDSGKFQDHQRMFTFFLQRCVEKCKKGMEVTKQQIPNGEHCNQALKKVQRFQENECLKKDAELLSAKLQNTPQLICI